MSGNSGSSDSSGNSGDAYAAGADLGGHILTSALTLHEQRQSRRFTKNLSNTSHQREVADLKKAGLNPILSANHGASTASGPSIGVDAPTPGKDWNSARATSSALRLNEALTREHNANASKANSEARVAEQTIQAEVDRRQTNSALLLNQLMKSDVEVSTPMLKAYKEKVLADAEAARNSSKKIFYELGEAEAMNRFWKGTGGKTEPWLNSAKVLLHMLRR